MADLQYEPPTGLSFVTGLVSAIGIAALRGDARGRQVGSKRGFVRAEKLGSFRKKNVAPGSYRFRLGDLPKGAHMARQGLRKG